MNNEIKEFSKKVIFLSIILSLITLIVLLIIRKNSLALGILLGSITSYITFLMHGNNIKRFGHDIKHPSKNAFAHSLLRLAISATALLIAFLLEWINIIATFIGLMIIKVVILIVSFLSDTKRIIKDGEVK